MSQTIKCPKCKTLIDVDEQIRKQVEEDVRGKYTEEERMKMENSLRKELKTQITTEVTNSVKLKHQTELQAEKTKNIATQKVESNSICAPAQFFKFLFN